MGLDFKYLLIVILGYLNPLTFYWFYAFYRNLLELAFGLAYSFLVSLVIFLVAKKYDYFNSALYGLLKLFTLSFISSLLLLVFSQLVFSDRVFGIELGVYFIPTYVGLGLYAPFVWVNVLVYFVCLVFIRRNKVVSGLSV